MSWKRKIFSDVDKWRPESNGGDRDGRVLGVPAGRAASPSRSRVRTAPGAGHAS